MYKSYTLKQAGWKLLEGNAIQIGTQKYRYFKSRAIEGRSRLSPSNGMRSGTSIFISSVRQWKTKFWQERVKASAMTLDLSSFSQHRTERTGKPRSFSRRMQQRYAGQGKPLRGNSKGRTIERGHGSHWHGYTRTQPINAKTFISSWHMRSVGNTRLCVSRT